MNDTAGRDRDSIERASVRDALRAAADDPVPDVDRLVRAVPRMMAEARRRSTARDASPLIGIAPLAARLIPRLAAAAAVLVLLTAVIAWRDRATGAGTTRQDLDSLLLGGTDASGVENLLLGKTPAMDDDNG